MAQKLKQYAMNIMANIILNAQNVVYRMVWDLMAKHLEAISIKKRLLKHGTVKTGAKMKEKIMANIRISMNNATAKLVHEGANAIVIPIKNDFTNTTLKVEQSSISNDLELVGIKKPPCQIGDILYLLETWNWSFDMMGKPVKPFVYKASMEYAECFKWHSPITMPSIACRHKYPCTKIEAVQVKDMALVWYIEFERSK